MNSSQETGIIFTTIYLVFTFFGTFVFAVVSSLDKEFKNKVAAISLTVLSVLNILWCITIMKVPMLHFLMWLIPSLLNIPTIVLVIRYALSDSYSNYTDI